MANAIPTSTQSSDPILTSIIINCGYLFREHWILFYEVREGWPRDNESVLIVLIPSLSITQCTSHPTLLLPVSQGISSGDGSQSLLVTRDNFHHFNIVSASRSLYRSGKYQNLITPMLEVISP